MRPHTNLFTQVDRTEDPDFFVRFMDEAQKPDAIQAEQRLMRQTRRIDVRRLGLDAGCGPGGRLVGLDASEVMIAEARRRAAQRSLPITFKVGEANSLPFPAPLRRLRAARLLSTSRIPRAAQRWLT